MCLKNNRRTISFIICILTNRSCSTETSCTAKNLTVLVTDFPPFLLIRNGGVIEGLSYHVFNEALKGHNVTYKIMPSTWTFQDSITDIIHQPYTTSGLMVDLILSRQFFPFVYHTTPISSNCYTFLVPKIGPLEGAAFLWLPIENMKFWIYIWPYIIFKFAWFVWSCVKTGKNKTFLKYFNTWRSLEMVLLLFISTYYCGFISTLLTHPMVPKGLETIDDLIDHNVRWEDRGQGLRLSLGSFGGKYVKFLNLALIRDINESERRALIAKNKYALTVTTMQGSKFCSAFRVKLDEEFLNQMHIAPKIHCIKKTINVILLNRKTHPCIVNTLNKNIRRFQEAGLIRYWIHNVVVRKEFTKMEKLFVSYEKKYEDTIINLSKLQSAFYVLLAGYGFGFIAFLYEIFIK